MALVQTKHSANRYWSEVLYHAPTSVASGVVVIGAEDPSWNADVQAKVMGTGFFTRVDAINGGDVTPTLAQLKTYKAILIYDDSAFADNSTMGDNLAAYVDGGGGVVIMAFLDLSEAALYGNWNSGGYDPLLGDWGSGISLTLGTVLVPEHPIMQGVTNFNAGTESYHASGTPSGSTTVIANYSNDDPLIIEKTEFNGKVVCLNFFPVSSDARPDLWDVTTQGALLMGNALKYVGGI
jgi:hypothetical protein